MSNNIIQSNQKLIRKESQDLVRNSVEESPHAPPDHEAEQRNYTVLRTISSISFFHSGPLLSVLAKKHSSNNRKNLSGDTS